MLDTKLSWEPLSQLFGAQMYGWQAGQLDLQQAEEVKDLLHRKQVLSFPAQKLSPEDLIAFGRRFGDLQYHVLRQYTLPGYPEIFVLSNEVVDGKRIGHGETGFFWHTDMSYMKRTTAYTILYAIKVPSKGGNTKFASSLAAYEKLPATRKAELAKLQTIFSYRKLHRDEGYTVPLTPEQIARAPDVIHPLVRTHPFTGQKVLSWRACWLTPPNLSLSWTTNGRRVTSSSGITAGCCTWQRNTIARTKFGRSIAYPSRVRNLAEGVRPHDVPHQPLCRAGIYRQKEAHMSKRSGRVVLLANRISRPVLPPPIRDIVGSDFVDARDSAEVVHALHDMEVLITPQYLYTRGGGSGGAGKATEVEVDAVADGRVERIAAAEILPDVVHNLRRRWSVGCRG